MTPFIRSDIHLISKGKEGSKEMEVVPKKVNDERNIVIEDDEREGEEEDEEPPKKLTPKEEELVEAYKFKKMNKAARVKHQAKKEARVEAERIIKYLAERAKIEAKPPEVDWDDFAKTLKLKAAKARSSRGVG